MIIPDLDSLLVDVLLTEGTVVSAVRGHLSRGLITAEGLLQLRSRLRPSEPVVVCFGSKYVTVVNTVLSEGSALYVLNNDDIGPAVWSKFTNLPNTSCSDGFFELGPVPNCCWTAAVDVPESTVSRLCRLLLSRYVRCFVVASLLLGP